MTDNPSDQEKKILVDEDWKSRVQAEKEEAERQKTAAGKPEEQPGRSADPLPPPSLEILASTLGMQAMVAMGLVPDPFSGKTETELDQAKHYIDTIDMLQKKTEGNRTPQETAVLENLLHELRLGYIQIAQRKPAAE